MRKQDHRYIGALSKIGQMSIFLLLLLTLTACGSWTDWRTYKSAVNAYNDGYVEKAHELLESIPNYKDPQNIRQKVIYERAQYLATVKQFEEALGLLDRIRDFQDSEKKIREVNIAWAEKLTAMNEHAQALAIYRKIGEEDRILPTILRTAQSDIDEQKYTEAIQMLKDISGNPDADDLRKAAEKGILYLEGVALLKKNDFSTARKVYEKAVKVVHNKPLEYEGEYLSQYCEALLPVSTRMGSEGRFGDVLAATFPLWQSIKDSNDGDCVNCIKVMQVAADRFFLNETSQSDWHYQITNYRKHFEDITARCDVYGGLFTAHLRKNRRLLPVLKAAEQIGGECNDSLSFNWDQAIRAMELQLSTLVLDWKRAKDFRSIILLQKYLSIRLKDLDLGIGNWGNLAETNIEPQTNFGSAHFRNNIWVVTGWVKNISNYRPLNISGLHLDCLMKDQSIKTKCAFVKVKDQVLPGDKRSFTSRISLPADTEDIIEYNLVSEYEDIDTSDVKAEDVVERKKGPVVLPTP